MPVIKNPAIRDRNAQRIYGCSYDEVVRLNGGENPRKPGTVAMLYTTQRTAASKRGIGWEITLAEWLDVWMSSGKWHLRGVGRGAYCMARHGDAGPYRVGNISIATIESNSSDGVRKARRNPNFRRLPAGGGRGWTFREGARSPYQVVVAGKYVGSYATVNEAKAAYEAAVERHNEAIREARVARSKQSNFFARSASIRRLPTVS